MRTIGRKYKNEIVKLVKRARAIGITSGAKITEYVKQELPEEAFDTWEMAHQEIESISWDEVFRT